MVDKEGTVYHNPLVAETYYGIETIISLAVGDNRMIELSKLSTFRSITSFIDCFLVIVGYMLLWICINAVGYVIQHSLSVWDDKMDDILFFLEKLLLMVIVVFKYSTSVRVRRWHESGQQFITNFLAHHYYYMIPFVIALLFHGQLPSSLREWSSVLLAPLSEEVVFRGYLCNLLLHRLEARNAVFASSFCFACLHFLSLFSTKSLWFLFRQVSMSLLAGVTYSYAMLDGDSELYAIILHSLNNLTAIVWKSVDTTSFQDKLIEMLILSPSVIYICRCVCRKTKVNCIVC